MASLHRVGLANIILDEIAMPELLQRDATAENLADALVAITMHSPARQRQCDAFARLDAIMEVGTAAPSERAAAAVIAMARPRGSPGSRARTAGLRRSDVRGEESGQGRRIGAAKKSIVRLVARVCRRKGKLGVKCWCGGLA
jgi:hypothetical protein